jgi:hypothetical protein
MQFDLFTSPQASRNRELDGTVDRIRERFGREALTSGSALRGRHRG